MHDAVFQEITAAVGLTTVVDVFDHHSLFRTLTNDDVLQLSRLGGAAGFSGLGAIQKSTGISSRRVLRQGILPLDLATVVCQRLEEASGTRLSEFDHILFCHSHVDPLACRRLATEIEVTQGLPAGRIKAFSHGCVGFLKLLTDAALLLEYSPVGAKVAMISVETPEYWHDASDRLFCGIVSAGATASVLEVGRGVPVNVVRSDDSHIPESRRPNPLPLFSHDTAEVFDFGGNPCHRTVMRMNPEPVFLNGIELMLDNLRTAMMSINPRPAERIIVAPHQPSAKLLKALVAAARTEFPEAEFLNNLESYGNTISCSIPTLLSRIQEVMQRNRLQDLRDGDHVILLGAGICMSEICNHMSAGHACVKWQTGILNASPVPVSTAASVQL